MSQPIVPYGYRPVILASDHQTEQKSRKIEIFKEAVYKDINLYTHKHVDAREDMGLRSGNAVSSDTTENVDGAVIARYVEFRDAQLRTKIQFALAEETDEYANDAIKLESGKYVYRLILPDGFNDNTLRPLAEYIHRFLVWGALYDWYAQFGMQQASVYGAQVKELEDRIVSVLRGPSNVKRPLQPFGPAHKIR